MNPIQRFVTGTVWRRTRLISARIAPRAQRLGVQRGLHTTPALRLHSKDDQTESHAANEEPTHERDELSDISKPSDTSKPSDANTPSDGNKPDTETLDFNAIFDLLNLPKRDKRSPPKAEAGTRTADRDTPVERDADPGIEDLLSAIDNNATTRGSSGRAAHAADRSQDKSDPMAEFERILSDLAANDTEVYKRNRPAPHFWNDGDDMEGGRRAKFIDDLEPASLFEPGPHASAFAAGTLASDPRRISGTASRVLRLSTQHAQDQQAAQRAGGAAAAGAQQSRRELDVEQAQLSRLAQCQSVAALSGFIYSQLIATKDAGRVRPSPLVFTECVRVARELQAPHTAYFLYNYCRTRMSLIDKLNVLNVAFYEELVTTAWNSLRDISAVVSIIQDAISLGVTCDDKLDAQIGLIIIELHKVYDMPATANQISALRAKMSAERDRAEHVPLLARKAEIAKAQFSL